MFEALNWGELGVGIGALIILGYLGGKAIDLVKSFKSEPRNTQKEDEQLILKQVVENNTAATNNLISFLQITLTKNEACMDMVVENTKHIPGIVSRVNDIWGAVNEGK